jgi:UDP-N-acetylmuramate--alanine ligase
VFGDRRIWAVLLAPGTALASEARSRYIAALSPADEVVIAGRGAPPGLAGCQRPDPADDTTNPIPSTDAAGSEPPGDTEARALARALTMAGKRSRSVASLDDAILELDRHLEPGDVLVTLGAGDVGTISDAFFRRLPRDRPGR